MDISHLVVLHDALPDLPHKARAYLGQAGDHAREIILVDNGSTDGTGQYIAELARINPQVRVLHFADHAFPSLRLNQAAELAQGTWLHVAESDSVPPVNLCAVMLPLLAQHFPDAAHGLYRPLEGTLEQTSGSGIESHPGVKLWNTPLDAVLDGTPPRTLLCRRTLFEQAQGADITLALPDTSLPLRLAAQAQRWMRVEAPLALTPKRILPPAHRRQERHDAFWAYRKALDTPGLPPDQMLDLYRRALSVARKQGRDDGKMDGERALLRHYIRSRWPGAKLREDVLAQVTKLFSS